MATRRLKNTKYKWVHGPNSERLYEVGILADGTLHNPRGYPDDVVREAALAANARRHARRSEAAKEAAKTRDERQERRVWQIAERVVKKQQTGPRRHCFVCGRGLADPQSIGRGIGSECWQAVLEQISKITAGAAK
jgi:hypothetical protein